MTEYSNQWDAITAQELRDRAGVKWSFAAAGGREPLGAWVAEMDFGAAPSIIEAWQKSAELFEFGYPPVWLGAEMADATANWYSDRYDWAVDAADIFAIADVIKGLELAITEFSAPGAPVIVPTPAYMPFLFVPESLGREVIQIPMPRDAEGGFSLDLDAIAAELAKGANLVILANPGNPTGKVYSRDELVALADVVDAAGGRVFSDEIHAPLVLFGNKHVPLASVSPAGARVAITATSASKAWNLPGLKCAQLILSADSDREIWKSIGPMAGHGASTPGIRANTAAYASGGEWLDKVVDYIEQNYLWLQSQLATELPEARLAPLEGTYLCWVDLSAYPVGTEVGAYILENAAVLVNSGPAFGEVGDGFIRLNIATPRPILTEIVSRISETLIGARLDRVSP